MHEMDDSPHFMRGRTRDLNARTYVLKPEYEELMEKQRLLLKLADKHLFVEVKYFGGPWYNRHLSERPFRLVNRFGSTIIKQSCFKTPEALVEAVQRIISND